jgi:ABC-type Mn2+/Zn2+ transport system permease subunit
MLSAFAISIGLGVLAAAFGYYVSFRYGVPTGAAMVALAGLFYLPSLGVKQR